MATLFHRFHNFILLLVQGKDHVCACTCGRHEVHHVIPYKEDKPMVVPPENNFFSDVMTEQEMLVLFGLLLGFCVSWFLLWLDRAWRSRVTYWMANKMNDVCLWRWMSKSNKTRSGRVHTQHFTSASPNSRNAEIRKTSEPCRKLNN